MVILGPPGTVVLRVAGRARCWLLVLFLLTSSFSSWPPFHLQRQLANYNFDFRSWPVDFHWEEPSSR